jgi:hypothetical protein
MESQRRSSPRSIAALAGAALALAGACGDRADESVETTVAAATTSQVKVSEGLVSGSMFESETAAASMGSTVVIAFNTMNEPVAGQRCRGVSRQALGYFTTGGTWRALPIPVPAQMGRLYGDPSVAMVAADASNYHVFVSSMASPLSAWTTSCTTTANSPDPTALCVTTVNVPKSGVASVVSAACQTVASVGSAAQTVDGTAVTVLGTTGYAAVWSPPAASVFFYKVGTTTLTLMDQPLKTVAVGGHVIFVKGSGASIVAPSTSGTLYTTTFVPPAAGTTGPGKWTIPPTAVGSGLNMTSMPLGLANVHQYTAFLVPGIMGPGTLYFAYRKGTGLVVNGMQTGGVPGVFQAWATPAGVTAFDPAGTGATLSIAGNPFPNSFPILTYHQANADGTVSLRYTNLRSATPTTLLTQKPCLTPGHYWGDYDEMTVQDNGSTAPTFWRPFTNSSTSTVCTPTAGDDVGPGITQHVSAFKIGCTSTACP